MRIFLNKSELETDAGSQLLKLCQQITADGKVDLQEIVTLRKWLRTNQSNDSIAAIPYLTDIMARITEDGKVNRDELLELHTAIERVIPAALRLPAKQARNKLESDEKERQRLKREKATAEQKKTIQRQRALAKRIKHEFTTVSVSETALSNYDPIARHALIEQCKPGDTVTFQGFLNRGDYGFAVLNETGDRLGVLPDYIVKKILDRRDDGYLSLGLIREVTGGTADNPMRGLEIVVLFYDDNITVDELNEYLSRI